MPLPTFPLPRKLLLSHSVPDLPLPSYLRRHFQSRGFICMPVSCTHEVPRGEAKEVESFLPLSRYIAQGSCPSLSLCLGPVPPNWISYLHWHLLSQHLCCKEYFWFMEIQIFKIMWLFVCELVCEYIYVGIWHNGRKKIEKFLGQWLFRQELSLIL